MIGARSIRKVFRVATNDPERPQAELVLEGRFLNVLEWDPPHPRIAIPPVGPARAEVIIRPGAEFPYAIEDFAAEDPRLVVLGREALDRPGHHRLVLEWTETDPPPEEAVISGLEARLRLADGSSRAERVPVLVRYEPVFRSSAPRSIFINRSQTAALASAKPAPVVREILLERNHAEIPFELHGVRLAGEAEGIFALDWETLEPGERARIRLRIRERPPWRRRISDSLRIHTNDPLRPVIPIAIHAFFD